MAANLDAEIIEAIRRKVDAGMRKARAIQRALAEEGVAVGHIAIGEHVRKYLDGRALAAPGAATGRGAGERTWTEDDDKAELRFCLDHKVRTLEDAIRYAEVDTTVWRVARWECTSWEVGMKVRETTTANGRSEVKETPQKHHLWRVWMRLERILPRREMDAAEALFARLGRNAPKYTIPPRIARPKSPALAELDLFDCHFANLSWAPESGENDDLRIKERVFADAIDDSLDRVRGYEIEEFVFPVGNDLHHVDTLIRTTTAGTPQDADGRYAKMIEVTQGAVIAAVEKILSIPSVRRVRLIYMPGNHDKLTSYHLCLTLAAWFRNCPIVEVDTTFRVRKYLTYGCCLFGYTHGDRMTDGKLKELPGIMAHEQSRQWADATCREWKTGHKHTSETFTTLSSREFNGVMVRRLRALTGPNAYHFDNLFIGNQRGAEVYLYDPSLGYAGHFVAPVRQ